MMNLENLEEKEQIKPKPSRQQLKKKIKAEINEKETANNAKNQ